MIVNALFYSSVTIFHISFVFFTYCNGVSKPLVELQCLFIIQFTYSGPICEFYANSYDYDTYTKWYRDNNPQLNKYPFFCTVLWRMQEVISVFGSFELFIFFKPIAPAGGLPALLLPLNTVWLSTVSVIDGEQERIMQTSFYYIAIQPIMMPDAYLMICYMKEKLHSGQIPIIIQLDIAAEWYCCAAANLYNNLLWVIAFTAPTALYLEFKTGRKLCMENTCKSRAALVTRQADFFMHYVRNRHCIFLAGSHFISGTHLFAPVVTMGEKQFVMSIL